MTTGRSAVLVWSHLELQNLCDHVVKHGTDAWDTAAVAIKRPAKLCALRWQVLYEEALECSGLKTGANNPYSDWELAVIVQGCDAFQHMGNDKARHIAIASWLPGRTHHGVKQALKKYKSQDRQARDSWSANASLFNVLVNWPGVEDSCKQQRLATMVQRFPVREAVKQVLGNIEALKAAQSSKSRKRKAPREQEQHSPGFAASSLHGYNDPFQTANLRASGQPLAGSFQEAASAMPAPQAATAALLALAGSAGHPFYVRINNQGLAGGSNFSSPQGILCYGSSRQQATNTPAFALTSLQHQAVIQQQQQQLQQLTMLANMQSIQRQQQQQIPNMVPCPIPLMAPLVPAYASSTTGAAVAGGVQHVASAKPASTGLKGTGMKSLEEFPSCGADKSCLEITRAAKRHCSRPAQQLFEPCNPHTSHQQPAAVQANLTGMNPRFAAQQQQGLQSWLPYGVAAVDSLASWAGGVSAAAAGAGTGVKPQQKTGKLRAVRQPLKKLDINSFHHDGVQRFSSRRSGAYTAVHDAQQQQQPIHDIDMAAVDTGVELPADSQLVTLWPPAELWSDIPQAVLPQPAPCDEPLEGLDDELVGKLFGPIEEPISSAGGGTNTGNNLPAAHDHVACEPAGLPELSEHGSDDDLPVLQYAQWLQEPNCTSDMPRQWQHTPGAAGPASSTEDSSQQQQPPLVADNEEVDICDLLESCESLEDMCWLSTDF